MAPSAPRLNLPRGPRSNCQLLPKVYSRHLVPGTQKARKMRAFHFPTVRFGQFSGEELDQAKVLGVPDGSQYLPEQKSDDHRSDGFRHR